jgi:hypothetical protein
MTRVYPTMKELRELLQMVAQAMEEQRAPSPDLIRALEKLRGVLDRMPNSYANRWHLMTADERARESARASERACRAWANLPDERKAAISKARAEGVRESWRRRRHG